MAAIRWTGKGLKLIGELLDTEAFEDWAASKGRQLIEDKFKTLTLKSLFGTYRAKRAVYSDASAAINSDAVKAALENQLIRLPALLLQIAEQIYHKGPRKLSWSDYPYQVVVCPRDLVSQYYVNSVVTALENSAELSNFTGLPAAFLKRTASTAEDEWFNDISSPIPLPNHHSAISGVDASHGWNCYGKDGHFYVALAPSYKVDVNEKKGMRDLIDHTAKLLSQSKVALGEMTRPEVDEIISELPPCREV
jgi:hypothetical protein